MHAVGCVLMLDGHGRVPRRLPLALIGDQVNQADRLQVTVVTVELDPLVGEVVIEEAELVHLIDTTP
jgi:hypothetical protein